MTPDVSVIIPTWNRRAMVREAIASVLAQAGVSFELIVVDDGSTDGTRDDLERLIERPHGHEIRIETTVHRGPAAARNRGVEIARAPLIAFLDSDDLWMPRKLERQAAFMRVHPEYAICQTQERWMRGGRRMNPGARNRKRAGDIFIESLRTCLISPSAVMMQKSLFQAAGGFDESMTACEDYDLWLRILADHQVGLLDEELVIRRAGHPDQLSASMPALDRFRILALAKLLWSHGLAPERRAAAVKVIVEKCEIYAKGLARRGRAIDAAFYEDVVKRAVSAWRIGPDIALTQAIEGMRARLSRESFSPRAEETEAAGLGASGARE